MSDTTKFLNWLLFTTNLVDNIVEGLKCLITNPGTKNIKRIHRIDICNSYLLPDERKKVDDYKTNTNIYKKTFNTYIFTLKSQIITMADKILTYEKNSVCRYGDIDPIKKEKNNSLTQWVNSGQVSYQIVMEIAFTISRRVRDVFPDECKRGDIFLMLKGGVVWGQSLQDRMIDFDQKIPTEEINRVFKSGDNDTGLLINPLMPNAKNVYYLLNDIVRDTLEKEVLKYGFDSPNWKKIQDSLDSSNQPIIGVFKPRSNIEITTGFLRKTIKTSPTVLPVYVSSNEIEFVTNNVIKFYLHRMKISFVSVDNEQLSAELFDISITDPDSESALYEFQKYHKSVIPYNPVCL
jgi:hypothetical protein